MCIPVVELLVKYADEAVAAGVPHATMRFCHDSNVGPLAAFLRIENAYSDEVDPYKLSEVYSASDVVPMGTNIQFVFYYIIMLTFKSFKIFEFSYSSIKV